MNRAASAVAATMLVLACSAAQLSAQVSIQPVRGFAGELVIDGRTGAQRWSAVAMRPLVITTVYDNLDSPENFGISSQDPFAVWGDSVITTGTGTIESFSFTLYNSIGSAHSIVTGHFEVRFRDAASGLVLATATYDPSFGSGVPPGYYTIITLNTPGVPLAIGTNTLVIEQKATIADDSVEHGIVSFSPVTVGSSPASMYTSVGTQWGGPGFVTIPGFACNPGYRLMLDAASAATPTSWGRLKSLYR